LDCNCWQKTRSGKFAPTLLPDAGKYTADTGLLENSAYLPCGINFTASSYGPIDISINGK